ncbi:hypothetical protein EJ08DRAFT_678952 [Tothia fuscella]|uniref:Uncharacterized protein n=1 Tax=Tothia fuscella TaxID=1048955 RepID=A0A9P4NS39_9PEZI|nr:hypothetical protein EJ08DRAFT_678952 [Tothia fuscella]
MAAFQPLAITCTTAMFFILLYLSLSWSLLFSPNFQSPVHVNGFGRPEVQVKLIFARNIPLTTFEEYLNFNWSSDKWITRSKKGVKVYHNYTVYVDEQGHQQTRFTLSQFLSNRQVRIPVVPELLDRDTLTLYFQEKLTHKRGFSVNTYELPHAEVRKYILQYLKTKPLDNDRFSLSEEYWHAKADEDHRRDCSWSWLADEGCPLFIPICFGDEVSRGAMEAVLTKAINVWHDALGPNRGVSFQLDGLCNGSSFRFDYSAIVQINLDLEVDAFYGGASPGFIPAQPFQPMHVSFAFASHPEAVVRTVHELGPGGVMPGADEWFKYMCQDRVVADDKKWRNLWLGDNIVPFAPSFSGGANELNEWRKTLSMPPWGTVTREDGDFDFDSIMLYGSWDGANYIGGTADTAILTRLDGSTWDWSGRRGPSKGDVHAVKRLYPDIERPKPPPIPQKPTRLAATTSKKVAPSIKSKPTHLADMTKLLSAVLPEIPIEFQTFPTTFKTRPQIPPKPTRLQHAPT